MPLLVAEVFMMLKRELQRLILLPVPPAQQQELLSHTLLLPHPSLGTGSAPLLGWGNPRLILGLSLQPGGCHEMRNGAQHLLPACQQLSVSSISQGWWSWRVQSLALCCSSLAPAQLWTPMPNGRMSTCFHPGQRGMLLWDSLFFSLCRWLAGCDGAEEIAQDSEKKETWTFSPSSLRKSNLRKFIHDQHTAIAHKFVNGNLVIHNTCVGDICSGVIQY